MKIKGVNPETGEVYESETIDVSSEFIESMSDFELSDDRIKRMIDNLNISADAKSMLYTFSKATIRAGEYVLKIGRKIIDFICLTFKQYPHASFATIFGGIVGFLLSAIPVIGVVLGALTSAILIAIGYISDIQEESLKRKIAEIASKFSPLKA